MRSGPVIVAALLMVVLSGATVAAGPAGSSANPAGSTVVEAATGDSTSTTDRTVQGASDLAVVDAPTVGAVDEESFERADPGIVVTVQLRENGDARWHITHRFVVNGSNDTAAFRAFGESVKNEERQIGADRRVFERFANTASEATGRSMSIEDTEWSSPTVGNGTGELTYSFTWTNFGQVDGSQIVIGDAFRSPEGTWFPRLYDGQRLVIRPPPALTIVGTPPDKGVTDRALVWDGYREFDPGYLQVVLERPADTSTSPTTTRGGPTTRPDDGMALSPFLLGVGFALLLVVVGAGSYLFARRQADRDGDGGGVTATPGDGPGPDGNGHGNGNGGGESGSAGAAGAAQAAAGGVEDPQEAIENGASGSAGGRGSVPSATDGDHTGAGTASDASDATATGANATDATATGANATDATANGANATGSNADGVATGRSDAASASGGADVSASAAAGAEEATDDEEETGIDETLLSDEERVLRMLDENGGRMKQANIVTETGWSNAKVSQLLSGMAEDDDIQKLRIGRENLITLPDENVADFGNDDG